jgi:cutinase
MQFAAFGFKNPLRGVDQKVQRSHVRHGIAWAGDLRPLIPLYRERTTSCATRRPDLQPDRPENWQDYWADHLRRRTSPRHGQPGRGFVAPRI